jgi:uncharacterized LabA/DUF88 family protein
MLRTAIYIDGENLRKTLEKYEFQGSKYPYQIRERLVNWTEFFKGIITKLKDKTLLEHRLIGARWYLSNQIRVVGESLRNRKACLEDCLHDFPKLTDNELIQLSENWIEQEKVRVRKESEEIRADLEKKYDYLEFKYVGEFILSRYKKHKCGFDEKNKVNYYNGTRLGERGVDVGMAVDMVTQISSLDAIVIVSGDRDFIPAIDYVKTKMVNVYSFTLARGVPPHVEYLSEWLKGSVDIALYFDELEFLSLYLDRKAISELVSPNMLKAIDKRIKELTRA